jgi:hypothetical protein
MNPNRAKLPPRLTVAPKIEKIERVTIEVPTGTDQLVAAKDYLQVNGFNKVLVNSPKVGLLRLIGERPL